MANAVSIDAYLSRSVEAATQAEVGAAFQDAAERAGFAHALYLQVLRNFERLPPELGEKLNTSGARRCGEVAAFEHDPWIAERLAVMQFYRWADLPETNSLSEPARAMLENYRRNGVVDVLTIPVTLRAGDLAVFSLAQEAPATPISDLAIAKWRLICIATHQRYSELAADEPRPQLSRRELDVMKLAAIGKTNAEIAATLGVSVHTVNTLIRRSYVKLGASNRVQASIKLSYILRGAG